MRAKSLVAEPQEGAAGAETLSCESTGGSEKEEFGAGGGEDEWWEWHSEGEGESVETSRKLGGWPT